MKKFIKELLFDKEIVKRIKASNINKAHLYNLVFNGKITLQEYTTIVAASGRNTNKV